MELTDPGEKHEYFYPKRLKKKILEINPEEEIKSILTAFQNKNSTQSQSKKSTPRKIKSLKTKEAKDKIYLINDLNYLRHTYLENFQKESGTKPDAEVEKYIEIKEKEYQKKVD